MRVFLGVVLESGSAPPHPTTADPLDRVPGRAAQPCNARSPSATATPTAAPIQARTPTFPS